MDRSPAALWWGGAPLSVLALALAVLSWRRWSFSRSAVCAGLAAGRLGLWAVTLGLTLLWWYHPVQLGTRPLIYFTYQSGLVFAGDVTLALSLMLWTAERALRGERVRLGSRLIAASGLALWGISLLSALNAAAPALTLTFVVQGGLLAGLYLALVNDPPGPRALAVICGGAVFWVGLLAVDQTLAQRTLAMNLPWPGALTAADRGASVVVNAAGARWLRAYATLPHPNILAGFALMLLAPVVEQYLVTGRRGWLVLTGLGWLTEWLTFSRAGWLGAGALLLALLWQKDRRRVSALWVMALLPLAMLIGLMGPYFLARASLGAAPPLEQRSLNERLGLLQVGLTLAAQHPLLGVGAGNFVIALDPIRPDGVPWEPVHNLWLLIAAETGLPGLAAAAALTFAVGQAAWRGRAGSVWPAALLGVALVALVDHFWWSLPPARVLLIGALALLVSAGSRVEKEWSGSEAFEDGLRRLAATGQTGEVAVRQRRF